MKGKQAFRVALLLSYLVLVTKGKGAMENTSQVLIDQQVNKIMMIEDEDVYDCIYVNQQPALNHPLLKNHKIQMEPSSFPIGLNKNYSPLHVVSQAHLSIINCPMGMVPVLRNGRGNQTVQFIDQVVNKDEQREEAGITYSADLYGVRATINVYEPKMKKGSKDLSQTLIQIDSGPRGHVDTIVAFYSVSSSFYGNSVARFHIAWWDGSLNRSCFDHSCPGFVQVRHNVGLGGRVRPVSVYNGPQYVMDILIFKDPKTKNWWLAYGEDNTPIGYWPSSLFTHIKDKGDFSFWGGFVSGPTASSDSPPMGSGHFAYEGYGKAAFIRDIKIVDENNKLVNPNYLKYDVVTTDNRKYTLDDCWFNNHGMHTYYGGPGNFY